MTDILTLPAYWGFTGENPTGGADPGGGAFELGIFTPGVLIGGGPRGRGASGAAAQVCVEGGRSG